MIFKKPYAFFVKHFRVINFILTVLLAILAYKLFSLQNVINGIYRGDVSNYSFLQSNFIGFSMFLLIFMIIFVLSIIIVLLRKKKKPLNDYLFALVYNVVIIIFFVAVRNFFFSIENSIVDQTTIKLYSDLSFMLVIPCLYFLFKFILIVIGFNLKKFDFTKDIIELKKEEEDNEEVELVFDKNTYKYKRGIRRYIREFKYYLLENKFIFSIVVLILFIILFFTFIGVKVFNNDVIDLKERFVAGNFSYIVNNVYETKYDLNHNIIKKDFKYVIASVTLSNNLNELSSVDLKRIRLIYGNDYVYASNYYNEHFLDLGEPYNNQSLKANESRNYLFIFKVPLTYNSKKYTIKFYDRNIYNEEELSAGYKTLNVTAKVLDKKYETIKSNLNEKNILKDFEGSELTIKSFSRNTSFSYIKNGKTNVIVPKNSNNILLSLEYVLDIKSTFNNSYFKNYNSFFEEYLKVSYKSDKVYKMVDSTIIKSEVDNRVFISVPYNLINSSEIKISFNFRDVSYYYVFE